MASETKRFSLAGILLVSPGDESAQCGGDGVVGRAGVKKARWIEVVRLDAEHICEKQHIVIGYPNFARFDFTNLPAGSMVHPSNLKSDCQLVL